ncbi:MAG: hypothetical protein ACREOQ_06090 [Gemmatimonadales bacterium]
MFKALMLPIVLIALLLGVGLALVRLDVIDAHWLNLVVPAALILGAVAFVVQYRKPKA